MKIGFDISPLETGHKYRGTGFYTLHLKEAFDEYFSNKHQFIYFVNKKDLPKEIDIIHYPYFDPFSFSFPLFQKKKTIVTVLDLTPVVFKNYFPAGIKGNLKWQIQKTALKNIAGILTDSYSAKKDIEYLVGINENRIAVAYLAAGKKFRKIQDTVYKVKVKQKYNLPSMFALYVGDVTWNKNVPRIVKASIQANIPLVMVGKALANESYDKTNKWNKDLINVQEIIKSNKKIQALGFVADEDLVALYNLATVFVMPSLYEGFGLPIVEAMSCGCPVITSYEGSLKEVSGGAAYIVDAYSQESITNGLKKVFNDSKLQNELSKKGFEQSKNFSWRKTAEATISFYEKILGKK